MNTLGLIGGMSWVSTRTYYEHLNRLIQAERGAQASAPLLIESLDYTGLARLSTVAEWDHAGEVLVASAKRLEAAGAGALVIASNAMHKVYDTVSAAVGIPIIHIAEAVGARMATDKVGRAALLGSRNVMIDDFYRERLVAHEVALLPPARDTVATLDRIIFDELVQGKATRQSERDLKTIITNLEREGAEAIVLGCTELEMIVDIDANVLPIYDCTRIHCEAAAAWILGNPQTA